MKLNKYQLITIGLVSLTICSGLVLTSTKSYADNDSATDDVNITVPVACSMSGHTDTAHNASLIPGTYSGASDSEYEQGIGKTTLTTFCNDNNGFSIYAIGFTGDSYDGENHTKLVGTSASGNAAIATKVYESSDTTSNWSMKVTKVDDSTKSYNPQNMTITNSFNNWHIVPDTYTKVAEYHASTGSSATDQALGAKVETTYASYISTSQPADTYTGKVKYVMVHPYDHVAPVIPTPGVYTLSRSGTQIGESIPEGMPTYDTPEEVMASWMEEDDANREHSIFLKHTVVNNTITESYAGFAITQEMIEEGDNDGLVPGVYYLKGGVDESGLQDKEVFNANVNILKTAFDYDNHPDRCSGNIDNGYFTCGGYDTPHASIDDYYGGVTVLEFFWCSVNSDGHSQCDYQ